MYLIQILLPLYDNDGNAFAHALFQHLVGGIAIDGLLVLAEQRASLDQALALIRRDGPDAGRRRPDQGAGQNHGER